MALKAAKAKTKEERTYWIEQIRSAEAKRAFLTKTLTMIATGVARNMGHVQSLVGTRRPVAADSHDCLSTANKFFSKKCFSLAKNEFALFSAPRMLANACMDGIPAGLLIKVMQTVCVHQTMVGIH